MCTRLVDGDVSRFADADGKSTGSAGSAPAGSVLTGDYAWM